MRKATKTVATWLGITAGIGGLEHGYFEILQGSTRPDGIMIVSMGPPCVPEEIWNGCEPAMTVIPNFLVTGILSVVVGLLILLLSTAFLGRKHGGLVLILLSVASLLFGGGLFPPLIGMVGGAAGMKIHKSLKGKQARGLVRSAPVLWPWPLIVFLVWTLGQIPVGYFFNEFLQSIMWFGLFLILTMLPVSVYSAYAHDAHLAPAGGYNDNLRNT